ncbi:unnamed protein product [Thlaspi arvense]|uniref:FKB95-like N-terminal Kelch domain-containing protein n=1 Tax=Thlaspi arvense TaxID=13288 RepID=A0AAU9RVT8_THLAR|nr:unnamed protein product [Thlaspi arvense]
MKRRFANGGCGEVELTRKRKRKVCGLWSLPDDVALTCLAKLSRVDLAALAMASKIHRPLVVSPELWNLRWRMGCVEPCLYVFLHIFPDPWPRWFIFHPAKRRLKRIFSKLYPAPESGSCFVANSWGFFVIGGLKNGKPTSEVTFFDCFQHRVYRFPPMMMARCGASASQIDDKIYVFGGVADSESDSSNYVEVFDLRTLTWELLSVSTPPKMPLKIQRSAVVKEKKEICAVDEKGQSFFFSPEKRMFVATGKTDSKARHRNHWCSMGSFLFCHDSRHRRILWCLPRDLDWKEVKGLQELRGYDICKLCTNRAGKVFIFWKVPQTLELWSAPISLRQRETPEGLELSGDIDWYRALLQHSCLGVNLLHAGFAYT